MGCQVGKAETPAPTLLTTAPPRGKAAGSGPKAVQESAVVARKPSGVDSTSPKPENTMDGVSTAPGSRSEQASGSSEGSQSSQTPVSSQSLPSLQAVQSAQTLGRGQWPASEGVLEESEANPSFDAQHIVMCTPREEPLKALWLLSPMHLTLQGEYVRVPGLHVNGEAVWRQAAGDGWLFTCSSGRWMVTDCRSKVDRDLACLKTVDPHYARLPQGAARWAYRGESGHWAVEPEGLTLLTGDREDAERRLRERELHSARKAAVAARRSARAPQSLWVAAPPRPMLQGEYRKVDGLVENGYPVWKQVDGEGWLFSSQKGHFWVICACGAGGPGAVGKNKLQIRTSMSHGGKWPNQLASWKYNNDNGGWSTDFVKAIRVSSDEGMAAGVLANYSVREASEHRSA